jgi:hypothetical protein
MVWMGIRDFVEARLPGGVEAVARELDAPLRDFWTQMFVAPGWYDIMPITALAPVIAAAMSVDRLEYVKQTAIWQAERDMAGVYKALLKSDSPLAVCRRFPSIHQQIYDFGKPQVLSECEHRVEVVAEGIPSPLAWWWKQASEYYLQPVLRAAGAARPQLLWNSQLADGKREGMPLVRIYSSTLFG